MRDDFERVLVLEYFPWHAEEIIQREVAHNCIKDAAERCRGRST